MNFIKSRNSTTCLKTSPESKTDEKHNGTVCVCVCVYIYIYVYAFRVLTLSRAVYRSHLRNFQGHCGRIADDGQIKNAKL